MEVIAGQPMIGMVLVDRLCVRGLQHAVQVACVAPVVDRPDPVRIDLLLSRLSQELPTHPGRQGVGRMPIDEDRHGSPPPLGNVPPFSAPPAYQGLGPARRGGAPRGPKSFVRHSSYSCSDGSSNPTRAEEPL